MFGAYSVVFVAYLITKDTSIVLIWTICATLATIIFMLCYMQIYKLTLIFCLPSEPKYPPGKPI